MWQRRLFWPYRLVALVVGGVALALAPVASAHPSLRWSAPKLMDHQDYGGFTPPLVSISCAPAGERCVAIDELGQIFSSQHPASGASSWAPTATLPGFAGNPPAGNAFLSCPTVSVCLALDGTGEVDVTGGSSTTGDGWAATPVFPTPPPAQYVTGLALACASRSLCVGFAADGECGPAPDPGCYFTTPPEAAGSTDPTDTGGAWHSIALPSSVVGQVGAVSCPSIDLCVAVDGDGHAIVSADPRSPTATWSAFLIDRSWPTAISCASPRLCVATDGNGNVLVSTRPAAGPSVWKLTHIAPDELDDVACPATSLCVAVDSSGDAYTSTQPTARDGKWTRSDIDPVNGSSSVTSIACPDVLLCVAVDGAGDTIVARGPSAAAIKRTLSRQLGTVTGRTITRLATHHRVRLRFNPPAAGTLAVRWYSVAGRRRTLIATGVQTFVTGRRARIALTITRAGRTLLKRGHTLRLVVRAGFTPTGAHTVTLATTPTLT